MNKSPSFTVYFLGSALAMCSMQAAKAQETDLNILPPCPPPDMSKNYYMERISHWHRCWGKYRIAFNSENEGDTLEGEWIAGSLVRGVYTFDDGGKYVGNFWYGKFHGKGTRTYLNGDKYVGKFKSGKYSGWGTLTYANGDKFVGEYRAGQREGHGIFTYAKGRRQESIWNKHIFFTRIHTLSQN
jgi:hypothetical protein